MGFLMKYLFAQLITLSRMKVTTGYSLNLLMISSLEKGLIKEVGAGSTDPTRHYVLSEL